VKKWGLKLFRLAAGLAASSGFAGALLADATDYPNRSVRVIVPGAPGSSPDRAARLWMGRMGEIMGATFVIENRPGANGTVGTDIALKAPADGYTLLFGFNAAVTISPSLYANLPYKPLNDMTAISQLVEICYVLVGNNDTPATTLSELLASARAKPESIPVGSAGNGSGGHLFLERLMAQSGARFTHVPYKSSPINDVVGGAIPYAIESMGAATPLIKAGRVKALAVSSTKRLAQFPEIPTATETTPDVENCGWNALWAPAGLPKDIVRKLYKASMQTAQTPAVRDRINELSMTVMGGTPEELDETVRRETKVWADIIKARNIKLE
jgi:tripartite-type tricarboxylate transporter receptor subunit TctC